MTLQVDATLLAVAAACNCSLGKLISNHHGRLSDVLKPAVGGLHPAVDLAAYVHLLLPWQVVHSACRQAVSGAHTASKVPEYLSPIQQVCVYTPALLADGHALCRPVLHRVSCISSPAGVSGSCCYVCHQSCLTAQAKVHSLCH